MVAEEELQILLLAAAVGIHLTQLLEAEEAVEAPLAQTEVEEAEEGPLGQMEAEEAGERLPCCVLAMEHAQAVTEAALQVNAFPKKKYFAVPVVNQSVQEEVEAGTALKT